MARKKSVIRGCGCNQCRWGMRRNYGSYIVQQMIRKVRHKTKHFLKIGEYDKADGVIVSTGYLD